MGPGQLGPGKLGHGQLAPESWAMDSWPRKVGPWAAWLWTVGPGKLGFGQLGPSAQLSAPKIGPWGTIIQSPIRLEPFHFLGVRLTISDSTVELEKSSQTRVLGILEKVVWSLEILGV